MSSILTNSSAMVALQTMRSINSDLGQTQSEISTGKSVATAKDNSAVWAISKVMESDVSGFEAVSTSLSTGEAMVSVARTAVESITDDLLAIKDKVIAGQDPSADTTKLNNEITELVSMIDAKISGAQFNGVNLIEAGASSQSVLGSIDRSGGAVSANMITVGAQDMATAASAAATGQIAAGSVGGNMVVGGTGNDGAVAISAGSTEDFALSAMAAGETVTVTVGSQSFSYSVTTADTASGSDVNEIAVSNLYSQINSAGMTGITASYDPQANAGELAIQATGSDANLAVKVTGAGSGALAGLSGVNAGSNLATIETYINASIDAAAAFGATESRLESQNEFVKNLSDSLKTGIGALVDADMEAASAKLQALQVQQQLATQALSIANQGPQNLLSLFR